MDGLGSVKILLVEDNPADARLVKEYYQDSETDIIIRHVVNGVEALDYLYQRNDYKNASLPDIIILDMNLPKVEGMTVLKTLKEDEILNDIPVIVFGTSDDSKEIKNAYKSHANCYIVKPIDYDNFNEILSSIENFWISLVRLPSKHV